jgi:prolycopene isomerase
MGTESNPGPLRMILSRLGVLDKIELVEGSTMYRIMIPDQFDVALPANRQATIDALKKRFPEESQAIDRFFDLVYKLCMEWVNVDVLNDPEASKNKYPNLFTYRFKDTQSVLDEHFKSQELKLALSIYWLYMAQPPSRMPFFDLALLLFIFLEFKPFHIKGGSQALSNAIMETFLQAGGEARFNCGAKQIIVSDEKIKSVITEQGDEITTRYVVSNIGPLATYIDLIGSENVPEQELRMLGSRTIGTSAVTVYMGLDCEPQVVGIHHAPNFICSTADMEKQFALTRTMQAPGATLFECYDVDNPEFSPAGACQIAYVALQYADPWYAIPPSKYADVKYQYAEGMIAFAEKVFPGLRDHIEEIEVATPLTHMRYLGQPGGAIYGAEQTAKDSSLFLRSDSAIQGLHFAGAWAGAGGFHPTLGSGVTVAKNILKSANRKQGGAK